VAYAQVTKHILALGALVLTLLPRRESALLKPALAPISPTLNLETDFAPHETCWPSLSPQLCPKDEKDAMLPSLQQELAALCQ